MSHALLRTYSYVVFCMSSCWQWVTDRHDQPLLHANGLKSPNSIVQISRQAHISALVEWKRLTHWGPKCGFHLHHDINLHRGLSCQILDIIVSRMKMLLCDNWIQADKPSVGTFADKHPQWGENCITKSAGWMCSASKSHDLFTS